MGRLFWSSVAGWSIINCRQHVKAQAKLDRFITGIEVLINGSDSDS